MYIATLFLLGMGENNCAWNRRNYLKRSTQQAAATKYEGNEVTH